MIWWRGGGYKTGGFLVCTRLGEARGVRMWGGGAVKGGGGDSLVLDAN